MYITYYIYLLLYTITLAYNTFDTMLYHRFRTYYAVIYINKLLLFELLLFEFDKFKRLPMCSSDFTRDLQRRSSFLHRRTNYSWACIAWGEAHRENEHSSSFFAYPKVMLK